MIAAAIMRQAEQRIFRCDRFRRNGVQSGSGDLAAAQGFGKGGAGHKVAAGSVDDECTVLHARLPGFFQIKQIICVLMKELGLYDLTPALCHLDYTMSEAGGVTDFVRQYTLASGGPCCDCGYKKKG